MCLYDSGDIQPAISVQTLAMYWLQGTRRLLWLLAAAGLGAVSVTIRRLFRYRLQAHSIAATSCYLLLSGMLECQNYGLKVVSTELSPICGCDTPIPTRPGSHAYVP